MNADKDVWAGLFFMGLAALGLWFGADYAFGTPARMGAGFLPKVLCWLLLGLGAIVTLVGVTRRGEGLGVWAWGELLAILDAVLLFGAALEDLGLEVAMLGAVLVAGTGAPPPNRLEQICLVVGAAALSLFLLPGFAGKTVAATGLAVLPKLLAGLAIAAIAIAVVSHARRVTLGTMVERVGLGVGLGLVCIIVFVDGLGLTMKSAFVIDIWNALKAAVIRPVWQLVRALAGF